MVIKHPTYRQIPSFLVPCLQGLPRCRRQLHQQVSPNQIPPTTPFVPDSKAFLTLIGRNLVQHAAKLPTWETLFSLSSAQLRELGVEPPRTRRYLLWWRDRYRRGIHGIGGDLQNVVDSTAELRVVEVMNPGAIGSQKYTATSSPGKKKLILNLPAGAPNPTDATLEDVKPVQGMKIVGAHRIAGPFVEPVKGTDGSVARIKIIEGMWEEKRGHKVDGGERRKEQVRYKRKMEEARKAGK